MSTTLRRRAVTAFSGVLTIAAIALSGCATSSTPSDSAETTASTSGATATSSLSPSASATASQAGIDTDDSTAEAQWTTENQEVIPATAPGLVAHDFRVGVHDDYYRVVVEFSGEGTAGWRTGWTDQSVELGRGRPLALPEGRHLDIVIEGAMAPMVEGQLDLYYDGAHEKRIDDSVIAYFDGAFENQTHLAVRMDRDRPYRVFTLDNPSRIVIDIQR